MDFYKMLFLRILRKRFQSFLFSYKSESFKDQSTWRLEFVFAACWASLAIYLPAQNTLILIKPSSGERNRQAVTLLISFTLVAFEMNQEKECDMYISELLGYLTMKIVLNLLQNEIKSALIRQIEVG